MADQRDASETGRSAASYSGDDRRLLTDLRGSFYGGPDRRLRPGTVTTRAAQAAMWLCGVGVVGLVVLWADSADSRHQLVVFSALRETSAGLLLLAGAALLVMWTLTGRAAHSLDGSALVLIGGGTLTVAGPLGALAQHSRILATVSPAAVIAFSVPALVLLIRSTGARPVNASIRLRRTLRYAALCSLTALVLDAAGRSWLPFDRPRLWEIALVAVSLGWTIAGGRRLLNADATSRVPGEPALAWALVGLGVGDALLAVACDRGLRWALAAMATQLVCSAVAARIAGSWLLTALSQHTTSRLQLAGEVADLTIVLADEKQVRRRLVRDARHLLGTIRQPHVTAPRAADKADHERVSGPKPTPRAPEPVIDLVAAEVAAALYGEPAPTTTRSWSL
jgi:hypothetical protein